MLASTRLFSAWCWGGNIKGRDAYRIIKVVKKTWLCWRAEPGHPSRTRTELNSILDNVRFTFAQLQTYTQCTSVYYVYILLSFFHIQRTYCWRCMETPKASYLADSLHSDNGVAALSVSIIWRTIPICALVCMKQLLQDRPSGLFKFCWSAAIAYQQCLCCKWLMAWWYWVVYQIF